MQNQKGKRRGRNKKCAIETEPISGTRDFYPEDKRLQKWLFDHFHEVSRLFGFEEYDCPILEEQDLYLRKAGEVYEEITQQMYCFEAKDKTQLALRPEMTPSLARLVLKLGRKILMPIRWYSIPQCWRFENVQRGRKREHYQWNMDIWGVKDITAEVELLAALVTFFKKVGLTSDDVMIKINSRQVLQTVLEPLGIKEKDFASICVIVDKLDKIGLNSVQEMLLESGVDDNVVEIIARTIRIKNIDDLEEVIPGSEIIKQLRRLWELAEGYGFQDWLIFDPSIIRGLTYYTGIVFEAFDKTGELRAICGGGRYDKILNIYGSKQNVPAVGFGFGDCVIMELLQMKKLIPNLEPVTDDLVILFSEDLRFEGNKVAYKLRELGRSVNVQLIPNKKVSWCYNYADRIGANRVIFVAPEEMSENKVRIKYLRLGQDEIKEFNANIDELDKWTDDEPPAWAKEEAQNQ